MNKGLPKLVIIVSLVAVLALATPLMSGCAPAGPTTPTTPTEPTAPTEPTTPTGEVKTLNLGLCQPFSGPAALWGIPAKDTLELWTERVSETGGVEIGGETYMLAAKVFDNESNASLALQGVRKLVLEDNCPVIGLVGGPTIDASSAFCTEHKVAQNTMATDYSAAKPYVFGGNDANPFGDFCRTLTVRELHPEAKRVALIAHDDSVSHQLWPWHKAGYEVGGFEIVYDKLFSLETTDFAPIISAALATNPDVIEFSACYPEYMNPMIEQLYVQGYEGITTANYIDFESVHALTGGPEYLAQIHQYTGYPDMFDPWFQQHPAEYYVEGMAPWQFWEMWDAEYGPGAPSDVHRAPFCCDWIDLVGIMTWLEGAKMAGTPYDNDAIFAAMTSAEATPTMLGPAYWTGEDIWGVKTRMVPPVYTCEMTTDPEGYLRIIAEWTFTEDVLPHMDVILRWMEDEGQLWWQRE